MIWKTLSQFNLGLKKGTVELFDHDHRWQNAFSIFAKELEAKVPANVCALFHIGSTSIPAICAKPVLDILGVTSSLEAFDALRPVLEEFGFTWKGEFGIQGRRYLPLYDDSGTIAFVHLHVFPKGAAEVETHLHFRDVLRSRSDLAKEYDSLKRTLAVQHKDRRDLYTDSKNNFIQKISTELT